MDPATPQIPERFESERLLLSALHLEDALEINQAVHESFAELKPWMPWAQTMPTLQDTQTNCTESREKYLSRTDLGMQIRRKSDNLLVGRTGFHGIDWRVPKFEIGYWVRTSFAGQGYITETVLCLTQVAFDLFQANRVEIRTDNLNDRSWRVAERAGYTLEGILRNDERDPSGQLRDTRIYAKVRLADGSIR